MAVQQDGRIKITRHFYLPCIDSSIITCPRAEIVYCDHAKHLNRVMQILRADQQCFTNSESILFAIKVRSLNSREQSTTDGATDWRLGDGLSVPGHKTISLSLTFGEYGPLSHKQGNGYY